MTFALAPKFTSTYPGVNVRLAKCLNSVFNVKPVVAAFNKEKALVASRGLLRDYEPSHLLRMELFEALVTSNQTRDMGQWWCTLCRYGGRMTSTQCPMAILVMSVQSVVGVFITVNNRNLVIRNRYNLHSTQYELLYAVLPRPASRASCSPSSRSPRTAPRRSSSAGWRWSP